MAEISLSGIVPSMTPSLTRTSVDKAGDFGSAMRRQNSCDSQKVRQKEKAPQAKISSRNNEDSGKRATPKIADSEPVIKKEPLHEGSNAEHNAATIMAAHLTLAEDALVVAMDMSGLPALEEVEEITPSEQTIVEVNPIATIGLAVQANELAAAEEPVDEHSVDILEGKEKASSVVTLGSKQQEISAPRISMKAPEKELEEEKSVQINTSQAQIATGSHAELVAGVQAAANADPRKELQASNNENAAKELSSIIKSVTVTTKDTGNKDGDDTANEKFKPSKGEGHSIAIEPEATTESLNVFATDADLAAFDDQSEDTAAPKIALGTSTKPTEILGKTQASNNKSAASVSQQITDAIEKMASNKTKQIVLDLHPGDLGRVSIEIETQGSQIKSVNFIAEKDTLAIIAAATTKLSDSIKEVSSGSEASLSFTTREGNHGHSEYSPQSHFVEAASSDRDSTMPSKNLVSRYDVGNEITRSANGEITSVNIGL